MAILFSTFISADNGNKADRHIVRMETVTHAIDQALRGNSTYMIEGVQYANKMKTAICKAYSAGFVAVGVIARYDYKGKVTPEIASAIAERADELADKFSKAFAEVYPIEEVAKTDEEKAKAKAKKEENKEKAGKEWAEKNGFIKADGLVSLDDVSASDLFQLVNVHASKFSLDQLNSLIATLQFAQTVASKDQQEADAENKVNTSAERLEAAQRAEALERKAAKEFAEAFDAAVLENAAFDERKAAEAKAQADAIKAERAAKRQLQKAAKELAEAKAKADAELVTL